MKTNQPNGTFPDERWFSYSEFASIQRSIRAYLGIFRWGGELFAHVYGAAGAFVKYEVPAWSGYQSADLKFSVTGVEPVQNKMEGNAAPNGGGGAVFWTGDEPLGIYDTLEQQNNAAAYGVFIATPATELVLKVTSSGIVKATSAEVTPVIEVVLLDQYGQVVKSDTTTAVFAVVFAAANQTVSASGLVSVCSEGTARFDSMIFNGLPGDVYEISFEATVLGFTTASSVLVELQPCAIGLVETAVQGYTVCEACTYDEFWDFPGVCLPCEVGMDCAIRAPLKHDEVSMRVGRQIYTVLTLPVERGYYRFYASSTEVYRCVRKALVLGPQYRCPDEKHCAGDRCACAGVKYDVAFNDSSKTHGEALCDKNSYGPLCSLCKSGYYTRPANLDYGGGCAECKSSVYLIGAYVVIGGVLLGLVILFGAAVSLGGVVARNRGRTAQTAFWKSAR